MSAEIQTFINVLGMPLASEDDKEGFKTAVDDFTNQELQRFLEFTTSFVEQADIYITKEMNYEFAWQRTQEDWDCCILCGRCGEAATSISDVECSCYTEQYTLYERETLVHEVYVKRTLKAKPAQTDVDLAIKMLIKNSCCK